MRWTRHPACRSICRRRAAPSVGGGSGMKKTVLAMDDQASVRQVSRHGCTDLNMPNVNGLDFIRALQTMPQYKGIPIVFLTTESDDGVEGQAKAAGATGWITKPFKPEQLTGTVKKLAG